MVSELTVRKETWFAFYQSPLPTPPLSQVTGTVGTRPTPRQTTPSVLGFHW